MNVKADPAILSARLTLAHLLHNNTYIMFYTLNKNSFIKLELIII
jgi:hypothetical protein